MKEAIVGILVNLGVKLMASYNVKITDKEELLVQDVVVGVVAIFELLTQHVAEKKIAARA